MEYSHILDKINEIQTLKYIYKENLNKMNKQYIKNDMIRISGEIEAPIKYIESSDNIDYGSSLDTFENVAIQRAKEARDFEYQRRMRHFCTSIKTILNDEYENRRTLRIEEEEGLYPDTEFKELVEEYHKKYNIPIFVGDFLPQEIVPYDVYKELAEGYTYDMIDRDQLQPMLDELRDYAPTAYSMGEPYGFNIRDEAYQLRDFLSSYGRLEELIN